MLENEVKGSLGSLQVACQSKDCVLNLCSQNLLKGNQGQLFWGLFWEKAPREQSVMRLLCFEADVPLILSCWNPHIVPSTAPTLQKQKQPGRSPKSEARLLCNLMCVLHGPLTSPKGLLFIYPQSWWLPPLHAMLAENRVTVDG